MRPAPINPTFTSGTSESFTSCAVALKAASAGTAPTQAFRIIHMLHQQHPKSAANPFPIQFPTSGNLIVASYISGGSNISSVSSSPVEYLVKHGYAGGIGRYHGAFSDLLRRECHHRKQYDHFVQSERQYERWYVDDV